MAFRYGRVVKSPKVSGCPAGCGSVSELVEMMLCDELCWRFAFEMGGNGVAMTVTSPCGLVDSTAFTRGMEPGSSVGESGE